jgi:hypothetical protein
VKFGSNGNGSSVFEARLELVDFRNGDCHSLKTIIEGLERVDVLRLARAIDNEIEDNNCGRFPLAVVCNER